MKIYNTTLIMPCFNEGKFFKKEEYIASLKEEEFVNICFVNDGSTDNTLVKLKELQVLFPNRIQIIDLNKNVGKAEAIRQGVLNYQNTNQSEYIGYFDADLAFPLNQVRKFYIQLPENKQPTFIVGARVRLHGFTNVERPLMRHLFSRFFATIVSNMLKISIYDTQTGAKLIKENVAKELFSKKFISSWLFDIELIYRLINLVGRPKIEKELWELPISVCNDDGNSSIKKSYAFKVPIELYKIWKKYRK